MVPAEIKGYGSKWEVTCDTWSDDSSIIAIFPSELTTLKLAIVLIEWESSSSGLQHQICMHFDLSGED